MMNVKLSLLKRKDCTIPLLALILLLTIGLLTPVPAISSSSVTDQSITDAVEDEFLFDQAILLNKIDVETDKGIVSLSGTVNNILAKERAAKIAETVKGVRSVVNRIQVKPSILRTDKVIKNDVKTALLMDPATDSYEIDVRVIDNRVILTGTVESWQEKNLSEKVAKGVNGVTEVDNQIRIDYKTKRLDSEIEAEVEKMLRWDVLVDDALIDVDVKNGHVTLNGTIGSAAEKSEAMLDAWVAGVKSVDNSELDVEKWARDKDLRKDKYVEKSDKEIEKAIEDALFYDPRVKSFNVTPYSKAGVVTLRGVVDNLKAKRSASQVARNTIGVIRVKNRIKVRPEGISDSEIAKNIREALARDPILELFEITVSVNNGIAYLSGTVDSFFEKGQADDVASRVYGVVDVRNNLVVRYPKHPLVYDPFVYDWYIYDNDWYDYDPYHTFLSDLEIKTRIESELFWSPFVDADQVEVNVEDGMATLAGKVDSWMEYHSATENAYEGGAIWVYNKLEVK